MKNGLKFLVLPLFLLISTASLASPTTSGLYLGANFGAGYVNVLNFFGPGSFTVSNGFAGNANLGYQFNSYLALETGFSFYTDVAASGQNVYTSHLAGKLMIPFSDRFNLFFKLGPGIIYAQGAPNIEWGLFFGAGLAVSLTDQLDIIAQTSGVTQFTETIGLYSLGLTYHFKIL